MPWNRPMNTYNPNPENVVHHTDVFIWVIHLECS